MRETYTGKVKLIYIDPPYNTGHDFIYDDNFIQTREEYEEESGEYDSEGGRLVANTESNGRFHSDWCSMIYPRLLLAKDMLSDDGVIFISIDQNEVATLTLLCDDIFGAATRVAHVAWCSSDSSNNNALTFSEDFNDLLVYSKAPRWIPNFLDDPEKRKHYKNPDNDPRGPYFDGGDVSNPGIRPNLQFDITTPSGRVIHHPTNGWRWSKERMKEMFKSGELRFSADESRVIKRRYLADMKGLPPSTLWDDTNRTGHTRSAKYWLKALFPEIPSGGLFSTPKPVELIGYILQLSIRDDNGIVLDFFGGSSTTAEAVERFNIENGMHLKWITVQISEPINNELCPYGVLTEFGEERIRRAGEKIKAEVEEANRQAKIGEEPKKVPDIGFRVFRVDSSNFQDVRRQPDQLGQQQLSLFTDNLKPDQIGRASCRERV